jgi:hypothetical protein
MKDIIACFVLSLLFTSCSHEQKIASATNTILRDPKAKQELFDILLTTWPCVNVVTRIDTSSTNFKQVDVRLIPFNIPLPYPVFTKSNKSFDTTVNGLTIYADSTGIVVSGYYKCNQPTITITNTIEDGRRLKMLADTLAMERLANASLVGKLSAAPNVDAVYTTVLKQRDSTITKQTITIILLSVFLLLLIIYLLYNNTVGAVSKISSGISVLTKLFTRS